MAKRDPLWIDADPATNLPAYSALEIRGLLNAFQAGVIGATDFKVTPGGGLSVDSAAGRGLVTPTAGGIIFPGLYYCADDTSENSSAFENGPIPANASANPRLDAVVLHVFDHSVDGSGRRQWVRQYVPGVASPGAALGGTLPALPTSSLLVAEVLVPGSNPTSIPSANIRDRRPWARGGQWTTGRTQNAGGTSHYTTSSTTLVQVDSTNLARRMECSGVPIRLSLDGSMYNSVGSAQAAVGWFMDGVLIPGSRKDLNQSSINFVVGTPPPLVFTPPAGSHLFSPVFSTTGGTLVVQASATAGLSMEIEELNRQNADNT